MKRVAIYSRVSTVDQHSENQTDLLKEFVENNNWLLTDIYIDHGISGSHGRDKRPEFNRLCKDMIRRRFDQILVWDISRLGRSLQHLVEFLNDVQSVNCDLYIHQQGLDTSSASGRMMFQMVGVFAEFERSMISERVKLGLQRTKAKGTKIGRPKVLSEGLVLDIWKRSDQGTRVKDIVAELGVSKSTVYRVQKMNRSH